MKAHELLKFLRISSNLSQPQVMATYMTRQMYSRLETGNKALKVDDLNEILDTLGITAAEFYGLLNYEGEVSIVRQQARKCAEDPKNEHEKDKLLQLYNKLQHKEKLSNAEFSVLLDIKNYFHEKWPEIINISHQEIAEIIKRTKNKKFFSQSDYRLISNHIMNFSLEQIEEIIPIIFPVEYLHLRDTETKNIIAQIFTNTLTPLLYKHDLKNARKYLDLAKENENLYNTNYFFMLSINYLENLTLYLENKDLVHLQKIMNIIDALNVIGDTNLSESMLEEVQTITEKPLKKGLSKYPTVRQKD